MEETRIAPRRRIFKAGTIESGSGIACHVKNLSETGAQLDVLSPLYIPDNFTLVVPSDQLRRDCHVVWRKQRRLGVAFD
jgi:hypothetical protein